MKSTRSQTSIEMKKTSDSIGLFSQIIFSLTFAHVVASAMIYHHSELTTITAPLIKPCITKVNRAMYI